MECLDFDGFHHTHLQFFYHAISDSTSLQVVTLVVLLRLRTYLQLYVLFSPTILTYGLTVDYFSLLTGRTADDPKSGRILESSC